MAKSSNSKKDTMKEENNQNSTEFTHILTQLLTQGKKNHGTLSSQEVNDAFSSFGLDDDKMEQVTSFLESKGIDILDMDDSDSGSDAYELDDDEEDASQEELRQIEEDEKDTGNLDSGSDYVNTEDPIHMYLKEIGRVKLLTADEEVAVATRIENSDIAENLLKSGHTPVTEEYLKEALENLHLTDYYDEKKEFIGKTEKDLKEMTADGKDAKNFLAESNLRLVISIAKKYVGRGMSFLDLIQEGNLGLMKAVEKFDYRKGFKFSTYATWWIRQAITRSIADQGRTIRIPVHMVETMNRLLRLSRQMVQELGREPRPEELAEKSGIPVDKIGEILKMTQEPVSLNTPIGEEDDSRLGDFIEDEHVEVPLDAATYSLLQEQLGEVMSTLTEREQKVLEMRFGLLDGHSRTLEEVGKEFQVTRERIRQIESKALRKLRHPSRSRKLRDFLE